MFRTKSTSSRGGGLPTAMLMLIVVVNWPILSAQNTFAARLPEYLDFSFESSEGYVFDGRIHLPPKKKRTGYAVVLIGGGAGTDMDWTCPGSDTINGEPTKDARRLANALVQAGYVVMRWSAFRRGDPIHAKYPNRFSPSPYPATVDHTRRAIQALRDKKLVAADHIVLLGHSNGARRACHVAEKDERFAALILMAGGVMARTGYSRDELSALTEDMFSLLDANKDGQCDPEEFKLWKKNHGPAPLSTSDFARLDRDRNGWLSRHEIATRLALDKRTSLDIQVDTSKDTRGVTWCEDIIVKRNIPVLMLYGSLDTRTRSGHLMRQRALDSKLKDFELKVFDGLGHLMSVEQGDKVSPMADEVIECIVAWMNKHFRDRSR